MECSSALYPFIAPPPPSPLLAHPFKPVHLAPPSTSCSYPTLSKRHNAPRPFPTLVSSSLVAPPATGEASLARDDLLALISDQERGVLTQKNPKRRLQILKAVDVLAAHGVDTVTTSSALSATWRMLWTTEKEQLFIIEKAHLFGTKAGDILQVIDVEEGRLNNVITFPPSGAFLVNSTIEIVSPQRVNFRFTSAVIRVAGWSIPVPPYGQGWFESIYLDDKVRVAKDIRGDYLVVDRAPYAWEG